MSTPPLDEAAGSDSPPPFDLELGKSVALSVLIHRTRRIAVIATAFIAYRKGFSFLLHQTQRHPPRRPAEGDHRRGSRLSHSWEHNLSVTGSDDHGLEVVGDEVAGGTLGWMSERYFVLGLPPPGPITISLDWPGRRSLRVSAQVASNGVLAAATEAEPLWPEG
jgi:hypothetical protein